MPKYKITASKSQKKYTFVLSAENEKLAKERIHKEGYSILGVELFNEDNKDKGKFIFVAEKNGEIKKGKVIGNDIFKIYLKLKDGVGYNILKLYSELEKDKDEKYKNNLIKELEEQYEFYIKNNKNYLKNKKEEKETKSKIEIKNEVNTDNFYLKKQLEETYKLIDFVFKKLKNILNGDKYNLDLEKKEKLKNLYNSLIKIKSSTNIVKLKKVGEAVLLKIGEIELKHLENFKDQKSREYLKNTNQLLKKIGSDKKFIEENKDFKRKINNLGNILQDFLKSFFNKKEKKSKVLIQDKSSHTFIKNKLLLNKYKEKLLENNIIILKNIFVFIFPFGLNSEKKDIILLKRNVIKQNIYLFKAKLEGKTFSYTKTLKGLDFILEYIFKFFNYIKDYLFYVVFFYSLLFLIFLNISYYNIFPGLDKSLNYNGIFYFIIFIFIYFAIYFSRGIYSLIFNFILLFFIFNFAVINF